MPLLKKIRVLAAKIETTSGTAESLAAADAQFNCYDVEIQPDITMTQRPGQGSFSKLPAVSEGRVGSVTFKTDITGDGAAGTPGWASTFLPACGFKVTTGTFAPVSEPPGSNVKTLTMAVYENGLLKRLRGASGTFKLILETGKPAMIEFTFTGVWLAPSDASILAPTYPTEKPLRFANSTMTIGGSWSPCVQSVEIEAGNEVIARECQSASDGSGYVNAIITDRQPTGTINPESELVASEDTHGDWLAHNENALSIALTDGTDTVTIAAPKIQYTNIQEGDRNGIQTDDITFQCNKSAAAGDDELTIDFS